MTNKEIQLNSLRQLLALHNYDKALLANALNVERHTVYSWFARGRISARKAIEAELVTGGQITKSMLRPDVKDWFVE